MGTAPHAIVTPVSLPAAVNRHVERVSTMPVSPTVAVAPVSVPSPPSAPMSHRVRGAAVVLAVAVGLVGLALAGIVLEGLVTPPTSSTHLAE